MSTTSSFGMGTFLNFKGGPCLQTLARIGVTSLSNFGPPFSVFLLALQVDQQGALLWA